MHDSQPIFVQIMEMIENDIITGVYQADDLIISTTQISKVYSVNPATAVKAVGKLADADIIYKKRGIGMCVTEGARQKIHARRKERFLTETLDALISEAKTLGISFDEIINILREMEKGA